MEHERGHGPALDRGWQTEVRSDVPAHHPHRSRRRRRVPRSAHLLTPPPPTSSITRPLRCLYGRLCGRVSPVAEGEGSKTSLTSLLSTVPVHALAQAHVPVRPSRGGLDTFNTDPRIGPASVGATGASSSRWFWSWGARKFVTSARSPAAFREQDSDVTNGPDV